MKITNIHELYSRTHPVQFGNINPHYDVLFSLMKSNHEELSSNDTNEGSSQQILGHNLEEESLHTDDFSTSTSTELKTTSSSHSDDLKTSSGSAGNESETNQSEESESSSDDRKLSSTEDTKPSFCSATETETTTLNDESEIASDDRKPSPRTENNDGEEAQKSPQSEHLINAELNQANQNHESFPYTLRRMLNIETAAGHQAIKWLADGDRFEVSDQNALEKDILPKYFPSSCLFQSFVRKLYRWGFLQVGKKKSGYYAFSNESFHRDNDSYKELKAIPRPRAKSSKSSSSKVPKDQPKALEVQTGRASLIPDEQLVAVQSDVTSQLRSIISSYSNNIAMLSSLHGTISSILTNQLAFGTPMNQPTSSDPSFQQAVGSPSQIHQQAGNSNDTAHSGTAIVNNVMRFLSQGSQGQHLQSTSFSHQDQQVGQVPHASMQVPTLQYAQSNIAPTLRIGTQHLNPQQNNPINQLGISQPITDTTGTTTDTSTSSQGQNKTEHENSDRKRRRSPTPP